jgi:hypothetical protein
MENNTVWCTQIIETGDGTGDAIIELPDELLEKIGWKIGDERGGPGNSDSMLSGRFASQSWPQGPIQEQQHDQKDKA